MRKTIRSAARSLVGSIGILLSLGGAASAQTYSLAPVPYQTVLSASGQKVSLACVWTYLAGTVTPVATYSTSTGTLNSNPIVTDTAGRFTAYLLPGTGYKFVFETPCTSPAHGSVLRTADNISGVPSSSATVDITATAGETIAALQVVYLSDGSGGKSAGQIYKTESATSYTLTGLIGIAQSAIVSGASGTVRIAGSVTGFNSLSVGSKYYPGAAGAMTLTAPALARALGQADTSTSFIVAANPPAWPAAAGVACGRLTLTTGVPITTADVTAATTLYYAPTSGCNQLTLWNGTQNVTYTFSQLSIAVPATTSQMYDVFGYDNAGTLALELLAWTNDTTRATTITIQNGYLAKTGDATRRYLGSMRTTTVSGQTEDSVTKRYVWNMYNGARRTLAKTEGTDTYTYTLAAYRQVHADAANQVDVIVGVVGSYLKLRAVHYASNTGASVAVQTSIGEDSATVPVAGVIGIGDTASLTLQNQGALAADLERYPAVGRHFYAWLERSTVSGVTTWYGDNGDATLLQSGIFGSLQE